jgi:hypothetical protein
MRSTKTEQPVYICDQCDGTGWGKDRRRCPCREADDHATARRKRMGIVRPRTAAQQPRKGLVKPD